MQEKVSIMCSWCGWENPSLGLRAARRWLGKPLHRLCCTTPSGWIFPSTPGTHERFLYGKNVMNSTWHICFGSFCTDFSLLWLIKTISRKTFWPSVNVSKYIASYVSVNWHYAESTITTPLDQWLICLTKYSFVSKDMRLCLSKYTVIL